MNAIRDAAQEVQCHLKAGYLESVYHRALVKELNLRGIPTQSECAIPVYYKGECVGDFKADIIVDNRVILELKACSSLNQSHSVQLVNYLIATGIDYGMLINFGASRLGIISKTRVYSPIP